MNKELKALSRQYPNIFNGDGLDLDEFIGAKDEAKKTLLCNKEFTLLFLKSSKYGSRERWDKDIEPYALNQVFGFASDDILSDENIILALAESDPMFFKHISPSLISAELIFLSLKLYENTNHDFIVGDEHADPIYMIHEYTKAAIAWREPKLIKYIHTIYDEEWNICGSQLWIVLLDLAGQNIFDDLDCFEIILKIFIDGNSGKYQPHSMDICYEFYDAGEWYHWTNFIKLDKLQKKISLSPHFKSKNIKLNLQKLASTIESQSSELSCGSTSISDLALEDEDLINFINFLKSSSISTDDK